MNICIKEIKKLKGHGVKVILIDSGINKNHPLLKNFKISPESFSIDYNEDNELIINNDVVDTYGHGTAISGILAHTTPEIELVIIKIFNDVQMIAEEEKLLFALNYIYNNITCDIIHMSIGILTDSYDLHSICKKLYERGIILVSAYDNSGAISYPAAYEEVIAVDSDTRCTSPYSFYYIGGNNKTVLAKGNNHRLAWVKPDWVIGRGTSFSAGYVTAFIIQMLEYGFKLQDICDAFEEISIKSTKIDTYIEPNLFKIPFPINNVILFPYNKEMHSLVNYYNYLDFNINIICDSKYSVKIGTEISDFNNNIKMKISSINEIDWDKVDTLILGHSEDLETKKTLLLKCKEKQINIYSFDNKMSEFIYENQINQLYYTPIINDTKFLDKFYGKLYTYKHPVIGVLGTSSKQGKFTLQVGLKIALQEEGYNVGHIGTEPSALLFNADACFPFGYEGNVDLHGQNFVKALNWTIHRVDIKEPEVDVLLVGSQSGTTPANYNNVNQIPFRQMDFLVAVIPDLVILCINPDDSFEYIERTIKTIEGVSGSKVCALALYPFSIMNEWHYMNDLRTPINNKEIRKEQIQKHFNRKVYIIGDNNEMKLLAKECILMLS